MNPKKWLLGFFILLGIGILIIFSFNYYIDPYGYQSRKNKYVKNLSEVSKTNIIHNRINSEGYYYLIGTSRMIRVDPSYIEKISHKKTHNIHIDGSTLKENFLLADYVKSKKKHFIYGFDAFSFNKSRLLHPEIKNRFETYQKELSTSQNIITQYFNSELLSTSLNHLKDIKKKKDFYYNYSKENNHSYSYSIEAVNNEQGYDNKQIKKNFSNYESYSNQEVINLSKLANKEDKFIIFPKYYYNYILFNQYQNINDKYLKAIKLLVENTDAEVWSFYEINEITMDFNNFDWPGWHFKPKIGKLVFARIFNDKNIKVPNNFGTLLTKENVNEYILELKKKIQQFTKEI